MDKNEKLMELCQKEDFKREVDRMTAEGKTTVEDLQQLFAANGLDLTTEEAIDLCRQVAMQYESGDEMSEEALESVAGGISWLVVGTVVLSIGAFCMGVYNGYRSGH